MILSTLVALTARSPLADGYPRLTLGVVSGAETVFRWQTQRCAPNHVPDAPARAFRNADGKVHLVAAHHGNRAMTGPGLSELTVDCRSRFKGNRSPDPEASDDLIWLTAFDTTDGRRIAALGHAEFHGHRVAGLCPSGGYMSCWRNSVIAAVSENGGRTFHRLPGRRAHVAALAYPYDGKVGRHTGYFSPSNIFRTGGHAYAFIFAEAYRAQRRGACLLRASDAGRPGAWLAWNGSRFAASLGDADIERKAVAGCAPIRGLSSTITSVVRHAPTGGFVALFAGTRRNGRTGRLSTGIYYVRSADLIDWSPPLLLLRVPLMFKYECGAPSVYAYPSLIDPGSRSPTFDSASGEAHLYLTRFNMSDCRLAEDRDLVRYRVRFKHRR